MAQKSEIGETLLVAAEAIWEQLSPLILPHYDKENVAVAVIASLVCTASTLVIAHWGKLFIFGGPRINKAVSKIGVPVSLVLVAILGYLFFWKVLAFLWGLVPAPFGWVGLKDAVTWLIKWIVPAVIFFAVVWNIFFSPLKTAGKVKAAFDAALDYLKKGWSNAEMVPVFTFLGALGLNYLVHHEKWSNKDTSYAPSVVIFVIAVLTISERFRAPQPDPATQTTEPEPQPKKPKEEPDLPEPEEDDEEEPPAPEREELVEMAMTLCRKEGCTTWLSEGEVGCSVCGTPATGPIEPVVIPTPAPEPCKRQSRRTAKRPWKHRS